MWTCSLLKENARKALAGKWLAGVAACLIINLVYFFSNDASAVGSYIVTDLFGSSRPLGLFGILSVLLTVFVIPVLSIGVARYFMENRQGKPPVGSIFSVFSDGFGNMVLVSFLVNLKVLLGYCLLIVPGVVWEYRYAMVPYLLAENPSMSCSRAMELSRGMMHGEKFNFFVLELSFIGWWILTIFTFGVGALFLRPYIEATQAEFYAAMRAKAFSMGITDQNELAGFFTYEA